MLLLPEAVDHEECPQRRARALRAFHYVGRGVRASIPER